MKLIKRRPTIGVVVPSFVQPGDRVVATVQLDARRAVPYERIVCTLEGVESLQVGGGNHAWRQRHSFVHLAADLARDGELPAGRTELRAAFDLPADAPPSYPERRAGTHGAVDYTLTVTVAIPWWIDRTRRFVLAVEPPPIELDDPGPGLHATNPEGPSADEPHLEFSLATKVLAPGDTLRGELALYNVAHNRYETARLALVAQQKVVGRRAETVERHRYAVEIDVRAGAEGHPIPFAMKLPDRLFPSWQERSWRLDWHFEAEVVIGWATNLLARTPVRVVPSGSTRRIESQRAPLVVGTGRVERLWSEVGGRYGLRFSPDDKQLHGEVGDATLAVGRSHRGGDGIFLEAHVAFPSLHLHLDGGRASGLRRLVSRGVRVGDESWDRAHYVTGREPAQVEAWLAALGPRLLPLGLEDLRDEEIVVDRRDAGQSSRALEGFVQEVLALARQLRAARAAIPPPPAMAGALDGWERLARRYGATVDTAHMGFVGRAGDTPVEVATHWSPDGEALHTELLVRPADPLDERHHLRWTPAGVEMGDPSRLSKRARALWESCQENAEVLDLGRDACMAWWPAPALDGEALAEGLDELLALSAAVRGDSGPYR